MYISASKSQLIKLDISQKISERIIYCVSNYTHSNPLLKALKKDSLDSRRMNRLKSLFLLIYIGRSHPALSKLIRFNDQGEIIDTHKPIITIKRKCFAFMQSKPGVIHLIYVSLVFNLKQ